MRRCLSLAGVMILLPALAGADDVLLRGGGKISGRILARSETSVQVDVGPGIITVPMSSVLSIEERRTPLDEFEERAAALRDNDAAGWFQAHEDVPHLATLAAAVWDGHEVRIIYARGMDDTVTRTLGPLGVVLKGGVWYVVAMVDETIRTYRVSRMLAAEPLETRFTRPADFDLATFWAASSEAYERDSPSVEVTIRLRPDRRMRLYDAIGARAMAGALRLEEADLEGWEHWRFRMLWPDEVPGRLMTVGSGLEVLEPLEIRARVAAAAARIVERYRAVGADETV